MKVPLALASCLTNECHHSWNQEAHVLRKTHLRYQKINTKHNSKSIHNKSYYFRRSITKKLKHQFRYHFSFFLLSVSLEIAKMQIVAPRNL